MVNLLGGEFHIEHQFVDQSPVPDGVKPIVAADLPEDDHLTLAVPSIQLGGHGN